MAVTFETYRKASQPYARTWRATRSNSIVGFFAIKQMVIHIEQRWFTASWDKQLVYKYTAELAKTLEMLPEIAS